MAAIGLRRNLKFKVNRPLSREEADARLDQKERRTDVVHDYLASLIKANSTYLEILDPLYIQKGRLAAMVGIMILLCGGVLTHMTLGFVSLWIHGSLWRTHSLAHLLIGYGTFTAMAVIFFLIGIGEFISHTHFPVRFNRRTRMVHVYRKKGKTLSVPWDKVFFTVGFCREGSWEFQDCFIVGHILSPDGRTIQDTFAVGRICDGPRELIALWEFIRRYMEEGLPAALQGVPKVVCFPVDRGREPFSAGWTALKCDITGPYAKLTYLVYILFPLLVVVACFRWFIMRINKRPVWPQEVEDACVIDPKAPHVYDVTTNPPGLRFGY